jgi:hypothetical protein
MITNFAIFRRESSGGYSSRGPIAPVLSLEQARREIARLRTIYPHQDFVMLGEIGETARERASLYNEARDHDGAPR